MSKTILKNALGALALITAPAWAAGTPEQQALIERVLQLWHPEHVVLAMVQRPAADALQQSRIALQGRVGAEKRDQTLKAITADAQRYIDEATPLAQAAAQRQLPSAVAARLAEQFSVEELRALVAMLESPVKRKFEQFVPQAERALGEQVTADVGAQIQPRLQAMTESIGTKLRTAAMVP